MEHVLFPGQACCCRHKRRTPDRLAATSTGDQIGWPPQAPETRQAGRQRLGSGLLQPERPPHPRAAPDARPPSSPAPSSSSRHPAWPAPGRRAPRTSGPPAAQAAVVGQGSHGWAAGFNLKFKHLSTSAGHVPGQGTAVEAGTEQAERHFAAGGGASSGQAGCRSRSAQWGIGAHRHHCGSAQHELSTGAHDERGPFNSQHHCGSAQHELSTGAHDERGPFNSQHSALRGGPHPPKQAVHEVGHAMLYGALTRQNRQYMRYVAVGTRMESAERRRCCCSGSDPAGSRLSCGV